MAGGGSASTETRGKGGGWAQVPGGCLRGRGQRLYFGAKIPTKKLKTDLHEALSKWNVAGELLGWLDEEFNVQDVQAGLSKKMQVKPSNVGNFASLELLVPGRWTCSQHLLGQ